MEGGVSHSRRKGIDKLFDMSPLVPNEMSDSDRHINFQLMRDHILTLQDGEERQTGKKYWRSLDELADSPAFREFVSREYPQQAEEWNDPIERRTFMKLMGASFALDRFVRRMRAVDPTDVDARDEAPGVADGHEPALYL